jgi:ABC-2 type transport system ATP-binding protein
VSNYSLGMKQRLGIAAALLGDPPILILDEPMNGLDPKGMVWLRAFLREQATDGRIVLLSSHLMKELEGSADRLVIIDDGRLIDDTTVAALLAADGNAPVTVRTTQRVDVMRTQARR